MTFAYPILLGGMLFAGIPILLHFLVRQKPRTLPFPALRFLLQKQRSNTRNLRLRHLLLLLLRVALLVLLCLALARPRLFFDQIGLISRDKPLALVLIFDTSPSMAYQSHAQTRLELAKQRSLELLDQLPDDCRLLVIDSADPRQATREAWLRSPTVARQKINGITLHDNAGPMSRALEEALDRLAAWEKQDDDPAAQSYPRFVCLFTDRTRASWEEDRSTLLRKKLTREIPVNMQTLLFDVGVADPVDLAITQLESPRSADGKLKQSFAEGEKISLLAVVQATTKTSSTLQCRLGGHEQTQSFEVAPGEPQRLTFAMDTESWKLEPGFHQVEVKFAAHADALAFNDQRYATLQIRDRSKERLLVLADDVKKADTFVYALEAHLYQVKVRMASEKPDLMRGDFAAVFLDGVAAPTDALWESLHAYVKQGGGLGIILPGDALKREAYNTEAAQQVMPGRIVGKISVAEPGSAWDVPEESRHPFLRPYRAWLEHGRNDIVRYPRAAEHYWDIAAQPENVIVRYEDPQEHPAILARTFASKSAGKVLLLTSPLDPEEPAWNNYRMKHTSFYVGLTSLCTRYLCPEPDLPQLNYEFGAEPPMVKKPGLAYAKYILSGPGTAEEIRFENKTGFWIGDQLQRAGNYTISGINAEKQETKVLAQFSLNIPGAESDLRKAPTAEIEAVLGADTVIPQDRKTSLLESMPQYWNEPVEMFPGLMILLLFLLAGENLLANRFYRDTPS